MAAKKTASASTHRTAALAKAAGSTKQQLDQEPTAPTAPVAPVGKPVLVRVRATRTGYHSGLLQRFKEGAVFDWPLRPGEKLPSWVERVQVRAQVTQEPAPGVLAALEGDEVI